MKPVNSPAPALQYSAQTLFKRRTSPRRKLLDAVMRRTGHFSAEEISKTVPEVGRATVYRTLSQMVDAGLICRILLDGGEQHYQTAPRAHHHHLVCIKCDRVVDVESCEVLEFAERTALIQGFVLLTHRLEMYGVCQVCHQKDKPLQKILRAPNPT